MSHDPPSWEVFDRHGPYIDGHHYGIFVSTGHVNRFRARYRVAHALARLELDEFHPDTEDGYTAITRAFLTYSAFEHFLQAIKIKQKKADALLAKYPVADWIRELRASDAEDSLFRFVMIHVDAKHKHHIGEYLAGRPFNYTYLVSAVRHTFAHGILTPSAGGCVAGQAAAVCAVLTKSLMAVMDAEFSERMAALDRAARAGAT